MAELVFMRRGEELMHYSLGEGIVRIGRGPQNDISFPETELTISRFHALVEEKNGTYWLSALTSAGLLVNNSMVQEWRLQEGDQFAVGKWQLLFRHEPLKIMQKTMLGQGERTMAMKQDSPARVAQAKLSFEYKGKSQSISVGEQPVSIGKSEENDIIFSFPYISRFHCRIFWKKGSFFLRDLDSANGVWLNGLKVIESELPKEAEIYLGRQKLVFESVDGLENSAEKSSANTSTNVEAPNHFHGIISQSKKMEEIFSTIERMAQIDAPVLINGESGSGKELLARALHYGGSRKELPFVAINCGGISRELIESILFGHEQGAFTGAQQQHIGSFEEAGGGTLFLDEIGDLPLAQQVSLLRVLEAGTFRRVGGSADLKSRARIVAATHRNISELVQEGLFREDLAYRVAVLQIESPPLRERKEDIELLANYFLSALAGHRNLRFAMKTIQLFSEYNWPGNVRELKNTIQRAIVMVAGDEIQPKDIHFLNFSSSTSSSGEVSKKEQFDLEGKEKETIIEAIQAAKGSVSRAARLLGIGRSSLYHKMKRLDIDHHSL